MKILFWKLRDRNIFTPNPYLRFYIFEGLRSLSFQWLTNPNFKISSLNVKSKFCINALHSWRGTSKDPSSESLKGFSRKIWPKTTLRFVTKSRKSFFEDWFINCQPQSHILHTPVILVALKKVLIAMKGPTNYLTSFSRHITPQSMNLYLILVSFSNLIFFYQPSHSWKFHVNLWYIFFSISGSVNALQSSSVRYFKPHQRNLVRSSFTNDD